MSSNSINTKLKFELAALPIEPPVEWTDINVTASFDEDNIQANINFDSFTFVNTGQTPKEQTAKILRDWIDNGFPGIFEGVPFKITGQNINSTVSVFDGFVNLSNEVKLIEDGSVIAKIQKKRGRNTLDEALEALTWGYLEDIGKVTQADYKLVDYVVEKKFNLFEILMSNIILFMMSKELYESVVRLTKLITDATAHGTGGFSGQFATVVWTAAEILLQAIYTALIAIAVISLGNQLLETLLPKLRVHRTITLRRGLEIIFNHLGLNLVAIATEFDNVVYLPSNLRQDDVSLLSGLINLPKGTESGIPNITDPQYGCKAFVEMCKKLINGKIAVVGNDVHLRSENDPYWIKQATFQMPDALVEQQEFNTDELATRFAFLFETDIRDDWTIDNYQGTSFEVATDAQQTVIPEAKFLKGLDEINMFVALGNRKNQLNGIENTLKSVAIVLDTVVNTLGGSSNLAAKVTAKIGVLKVSDNNYTKPKLLYTGGGLKLPLNHRQLFSARVMYVKYYNYKSFIQNNFQRQRLVFNQVSIPFGLVSFLQLIDNSYFYDSQNRLGKVQNIDWGMFKDTAVVNYWIQKKYAPNLKETFIEQT